MASELEDLLRSREGEMRIEEARMRRELREQIHQNDVVLTFKK